MNNPTLYGQDTAIAAAISQLVTSYDAAGKLLICGNGGSAADCEHIVGELMKGSYIKKIGALGDWVKVIRIALLLAMQDTQCFGS